MYYSVATEVPEDWEQWAPWTKVGIELVRKRKCKNDPKTGNCRGKNVQRKKYKKKPLHQYEYEYEYEIE